MNIRSHQMATLSVLVFVIFFPVGWWLIAGLVPPISPTADADAVAAAYQTGNGWIRFGMVIATITPAFLLPWAAALSHHMRRMEGSKPVWAQTQLAAATVTVTMVTVATVMWSVAAYRPDRDPQLQLLLSDIAWIGFTMPVAGIVVWMLTVGIAILGDRGESPILPRWTGYLSLWAATLSAPGFLVVAVQGGPFAWNGLFAFWIALVMIISWWTILAFFMLRATGEEQRSESW